MVHRISSVRWFANFELPVADLRMPGEVAHSVNAFVKETVRRNEKRRSSRTHGTITRGSLSRGKSPLCGGCCQLRGGVRQLPVEKLRRSPYGTHICWRCAGCGVVARNRRRCPPLFLWHREGRQAHAVA